MCPALTCLLFRWRLNLIDGLGRPNKQAVTRPWSWLLEDGDGERELAPSNRSWVMDGRGLDEGEENGKVSWAGESVQSIASRRTSNV